MLWTVGTSAADRWAGRAVARRGERSTPPSCTTTASQSAPGFRRRAIRRRTRDCAARPPRREATSARSYGGEKVGVEKMALSPPPRPSGLVSPAFLARAPAPRSGTVPRHAAAYAEAAAAASRRRGCPEVAASNRAPASAPAEVGVARRHAPDKLAARGDRPRGGGGRAPPPQPLRCSRPNGRDEGRCQRADKRHAGTGALRTRSNTRARAVASKEKEVHEEPSWQGGGAGGGDLCARCGERAPLGERCDCGGFDPPARGRLGAAPRAAPRAVSSNVTEAGCHGIRAAYPHGVSGCCCWRAST